MSFPLWERGLKHELIIMHIMQFFVVPLVGTWIETAMQMDA